MLRKYIPDVMNRHPVGPIMYKECPMLVDVLRVQLQLFNLVAIIKYHHSVKLADEPRNALVQGCETILLVKLHVV